MNLKVIFYVYEGYNLLLGLSFVLMPAAMMQGAGITPTGDLGVTHQIWGAALMGIGLIALTLRGADGNDALRETARSFSLFTGRDYHHLPPGDRLCRATHFPQYHYQRPGRRRNLHEDSIVVYIIVAAMQLLIYGLDQLLFNQPFRPAGGAGSNRYPGHTPGFQQ